MSTHVISSICIGEGYGAASLSLIIFLLSCGRLCFFPLTVPWVGLQSVIVAVAVILTCTLVAIFLQAKLHVAGLLLCGQN